MALVLKKRPRSAGQEGATQKNRQIGGWSEDQANSEVADLPMNPVSVGSSEKN